MNISDNARAGKRIILNERMSDTIIPEPVRKIIEDWTNRLMKELDEWQYLYYSGSVAMTFVYDGVRYEIRPSAFDLPIDAQAIMEMHQKELSEDLTAAGCESIMCFGRID